MGRRVIDSASSASGFSQFLAFWRCFKRQTGARLWLAVTLLIAIGLLEGSGLLLLVPLLHVIGLGRDGQLGGLSGSVADVLRGKALAFVLEHAVVTDASGRSVDLNQLERDAADEG